MIFKKLFKKFSGKSGKSGKNPLHIRHGKIPDVTLVEQGSGPFSSIDSHLKSSVNIEIDIFVNGEKIAISPIKKQLTKVGRDPSQVDIIVAEPIISKVHCTFEKVGKELFIADNNSTNGMYINSIKTVSQQLKNGDIISLGKKGTVQLIVHKEELQ